MHKIARISLANIKRHRRQSILLGLLIMICMTISTAAFAGQADMKKIFPNVAENTAVHKSAMLIKNDLYNDGIVDMLAADERVTATDHMGILYSNSSKYLDSKGEERALYMSIVTQEKEHRIENYEIETSLSTEEIAALEHPIYLPYGGKDSLGFGEGDTFDIVYGTKLFSFTVAGFYESVFMPETNNGFQMIVSDSDYITLMSVFDRWEMVVYDCTDPEESRDIFNDFCNSIEEQTGKDVGMQIMPFTYHDLKDTSMLFISIVIYIMLVMAVTILIAAAVLIRFRINGDIQDQIQSIGVLEALGYTSGNITLAYTLEYLIIALAGIIAGAALLPILLNILHGTGEALSGHHGKLTAEILPIFLTAAAIMLLVGMTAFFKARMVKNYPPVMAFRKGIAAHHFKRNILPLRSTGGNVHIRLAMKGFLENIRHNIGITVCILIAAAAAGISVIMANTFGSDLDVARNMAGSEFNDFNLTLAEYADVDELADEIGRMPGVRKVLKGTFSLDIGAWNYLYSFDRTERFLPVAYADFGECEDIKACDGRLPQHDNEVAVSMIMSTKHGLKVGDTLVLEKERAKKNYIITGLVTAVTNSGQSIYITHEGLQRLAPTMRPHALDIYLEDGVDREEFKAMLLDTYGQSISDTRKYEASGDTAEERIRAKADREMAELMAAHDVSHLEYTIRMGDKVISGTSDRFLIKNIQNLNDVMMTQIGGLFHSICMSAYVFMAVTAVVIGVIITMLMEQTVRKQRKELGIMLGMGYTTKELMLQMAMRIMPAVIIAVVLGSVLGVFVFKAVIRVLFGRFYINMLLLIAAGAVMVIFCFICAYIGAGKIKKISVTELMTE